MGRFFYPIVFLIAASGFILGGSFEATYFPHSHLVNQSRPTESDCKCDGEKKNESVWERTTSDPIALYTLALTVFTGVLAWATIGLLRETRNTVNILSETERPHMLISEIKVKGITSPPDIDGMVSIYIDYRTVNYGRSPAFLTDACVNYEIVSILPANPQYVSPIATRFIIAVGGWYGSVGKPAATRIDADKIRKVLMGESEIYIIGYIFYTGSSSRPHKSRFCYRMIFDGDASVRFDPDGPDSYWENT